MRINLFENFTLRILQIEKSIMLIRARVVIPTVFDALEASPEQNLDTTQGKRRYIAFD